MHAYSPFLVQSTTNLECADLSALLFDLSQTSPITNQSGDLSLHSHRSVLVDRDFRHLRHVTIEREMRSDTTTSAGRYRFAPVCFFRHQIEHAAHPGLIGKE